MRPNRTLTKENNINGLHLTGWFLAFLLLGGTGGAVAGEQNKHVSKAKRTSAVIYHDYCSVCHGDKGDGQSRARGSFAVPPRDYTTPEAAIELSRERMIHSVTYGREGTAMTAWRTELTAAEIEGVVDYIRATFMRLDSNTAARAKPSGKLLASRGGVLYMQACAMCHGDTGKRMTSGRMQPPPTDFTLPVAAAELTRERMIASVTHGRTGTAMTGYANRFSQGDIEAMVDFIRKAFMNAAAGAKPPVPKAAPKSALSAPSAAAAKQAVADMSLPMPQGLKGDPAKGRNFYVQNCYTCHGATGGGDGPRAYFINPPPRNFLLEASRQKLNRTVLFQAISEGRPGTDMPSWGKVLSNQEIADIAEFVFQDFISAPSGNKRQETGGK